MKNPLTNEQILQIIKDKAKELGRVPQRREVGMWSTIYNRFGSWSNALTKAGLTPKIIYGLSEKEILNIIKKWAKKHGKTPSISDWKKSKKNGEYLPEVKGMQRKFNKTWNEIMQLAGLEINVESKSYDNYTDKELLDMLKKEIKRIGVIEQTKFDKLRNKNLPSVTFYRTHFKMSWMRLLIKLGYKTKELKYLSYSKEELIKILQDLHKELGRTPTMFDLQQRGISESQFKDKFNSWNNAVKCAGLDENIIQVEVTETKDQLLRMYIDFSNKLGRLASATDLNNSKEIYNCDIFTIRFGGMPELKELAGFPIIEGNKKYTKEKLTKLLLKEYKKLGRKLTNREIRENKDLPSLNTFCRYFKTTKMSEVWEEIL